MASNGINGSVEALKTKVLPVKSSVSELGQFSDSSTLSQWVLPTQVPLALKEAATHIRTTAIPVAFPTETVYGLGADATRSDAVKGIYTAKGRPSDNPLIIHVSDLTMLRSLISPGLSPEELKDEKKDPIPEIYHTLIKKFWPGPLTILLPNPDNTKLAPEVTAGLKTFGARMPKTPLALSLISLAGVPIAAPSANASTKPSPTTAEHVLHDLNSRIEIILDGGPCAVGVESTVVDGLCSPPVVLRPGGVSLDDIRACKGWEGCVKAYKDASEVGANGIAPRAPGMKYKHYSPKAKVMLFEASCPDMLMQMEVLQEMAVAMAVANQSLGKNMENNTGENKVGIIRTKRSCDFDRLLSVENRSVASSPTGYPVQEGNFRQGPVIKGKTFQISLGEDTKVIAHGLFSALRDLDQRNVDVIFVEGISDEGDIAAAVMNRLRKAASVIHH